MEVRVQSALTLVHQSTHVSSMLACGRTAPAASPSSEAPASIAVLSSWSSSRAKAGASAGSVTVMVAAQAVRSVMRCGGQRANERWGSSFPSAF